MSIQSNINRIISLAGAYGLRIRSEAERKSKTVGKVKEVESESKPVSSEGSRPLSEINDQDEFEALMRATKASETSLKSEQTQKRTSKNLIKYLYPSSEIAKAPESNIGIKSRLEEDINKTLNKPM